MKTFKQLVSEVSQPVSPDEKRFKDQHVIQKFDYPVKDSDNMFKGTVSGSAKRPADQADDANYDKAYASRKAPTSNIGESVEELDEISADLAKKALDKRSDQYNRLSKGAERADALKNRAINKAAKRRNREMGTNDAKEREIAKHIDTAKKADTKAANLRSRAKTPDKKADKTYDYMKKRGMKTESVEQIDEISKDLAGRYIKKAQISTADAGRDTMDDRPHIRKRGINKIVNRRMGTADAVRKLTGKARVPATESVELSENPMEEKPMMMNALRSMSHNMQGIAQYVAKTSDPEEWFQNKLAGVAKEMQTLYSYATAETMSMGEEAAVTEAKKITAKDMKRALAGMKVKGKDEVSLKKAPWEKKEDVNEVTQSATKKMVNVTGPDGKVHTVMRKTKTTQYDDKGQEKIKTNEEVEYIDEAVKVGNMKLRDGSSVKVTKEDAKLLNQMFKDLNSANRRKMEQVMMTDKAGFEEIRGFAREAL